MSETLAQSDVHTDRLLQARFFAVPAGAKRDRRPTDVVVLVTSLVVLAVFATRAGEPLGGFEAALSELVSHLPAFLDPVWQIAYDALAVWAFCVTAVAVARRRWGLVRDLAITVVTVICSAALVGWWTNATWPDVVDGMFGTDGPVDYPAVGLALWIAIGSLASSHVSRPYRYLGRWIAIAGGCAAVALGVTTPSGAVGAVALGLAVAASVHLCFGSPGGLPSMAQVQAALAGIGVEAEPIDVMRRRGVVCVRARDATGADLDVKIYGRDAWDGQLLVSLWRFVWYRDGAPTLAVTRLQQVEHEAFLTLLAERRGAAVNPVVAAGADSIGDALLVTRRFGRPLVDITEDPDEGLGASMWRSLRALHDAGIAHGSIDAERVFVDGDVVRFADLSAATVESVPSAFEVDRAQVLVTTAVTVGTARAVAAALAALGPEDLANASTYVQPAALSGRLRRDAAAAELDIDDVRAAAVAAAGVERRELQQLRRLTWGRVLMAVLLFIAGSTLVSSLTDIGLDTIADAMRDASLPIVVLAFLVSMSARFANAVALSGLAPTKVPLGRLTMLQLAMSFVNLAMPATAGRVAINIRFFQRSGVEPTTAVAIGAIDGFTGFLSQMTLMGTVLIFGLGTLELHLDETFSIDNVGALLLALVIALAVAIAVVVLVSSLRRRVVDALTKLREFLVPLLRTPRRLVTALSANLVAELIYALTQYIVLAAFDQSVPFADVVLVNIGVSLFAGLMPVPGGIGVTEAALTAGFIAMGVPEATAFAAALTSRVVTYYTPPVFGVFAFRWLQRRHYL